VSRVRNPLTNVGEPLCGLLKLAAAVSRPYGTSEAFLAGEPSGYLSKSYYREQKDETGHTTEGKRIRS